MREKIILKEEKAPNGEVLTCKLSLLTEFRSLTRSESEFSSDIATLTIDQGISIAMGEDKISWEGEPPEQRDQELGKILVKLRLDTEDGQVMWGVWLVKGSLSEHLSDVGSYVADQLFEILGPSVVENLDETKKEYRRQSTLHTIHNLRARADQLEASLNN